jgi:hypothetical protein
MRLHVLKQYLAIVAVIAVFVPSFSYAGPSCKCRYAGKTFDVNTCVCLNVAAGAQMACCDMVVNNTSWTFSQRACPMSSIPEANAPIQSAALLSDDNDHRQSSPFRPLRQNSLLNLR